MPEQPLFDFVAFLSYSRRDVALARKLQADLEWYRIPTDLAPPEWLGERRHLRPIYRDQSDADVGNASFWHEAQQQIKKSRYLIVLCSPESAQSPNVDREVRLFLQSRPDGIDHLLPVILHGAPRTGDPATECLCPALLELGPDFSDRNFPSLVNASHEELLLHTVAYLLRVKYSVINDRYQRMRRRRLRQLLALSTAATIIFAVLMIWAIFAQREATAQRNAATLERDKAIAAQKEAELRQRESKAVVRFLVDDMLAAASSADMRASGATTQIVDQVLVPAAANVSRRFKDQPRIEAAITNALAMAFWECGEPRYASPQGRRSVDLYTRTLGPEDPDTLASTSDFALILSALGDSQQAEKLLRRTLPLDERILGKSHPQTLVAASNLGTVLAMTAQFDQAEPYLRQAVAGMGGLGDSADIPRSRREAYIINWIHCLVAMKKTPQELITNVEQLGLNFDQVTAIMQRAPRSGAEN